MSPAITIGVGLFGVLLAAGMRRQPAVANASGEELSRAGESLYGAIAEHLGGLKTAMSHGAVDRHESSFLRFRRRPRSTGLPMQDAWWPFKTPIREAS